MSKCRLRIRFPSRMTISSSLLRVRRSCREKRARSGAGVLAREAHRQDLAALLAAAAENCASPLGFHARAESVCADAALIPGTICGLTHLKLQFGTALQVVRRELGKVSACGARW